MPLPPVNINAYTARWCRSPRGPLLPVLGWCPYGGCSPTARRARRKLTRAGQFRCSAATVARPVAVRPSMSRKSVPQAKWRDQRWRRGLNRGTDRPVWGSRAWVLAYLWPLHAGHAQANSAAVLPAPRTRGTTCSQTNGAQEKAGGMLTVFAAITGAVAHLPPHGPRNGFTRHPGGLRGRAPPSRLVWIGPGDGTISPVHRPARHRCAGLPGRGLDSRQVPAASSDRARCGR